MALDAFGLSVPSRQLRAAALDAQHMYGNGVGTLITALAQVVQQNGLTALDLRYGSGSRSGLYPRQCSEPSCGSKLYAKTERLGHYAWIPRRLLPEQWLPSYMALVRRYCSGNQQFQCCSLVL